MAKLFNNIRKKLVSEKPSTARTANYLKYAIGEIVLVVIGILIALSINTWNQNKQQQKVEISTLKALASEFKENRNSIQSCKDHIIKMRLSGDSIRMQIGPKLSPLNTDNINRIIGDIGSTLKCKVSIDILEDIQGSGKLNLLTNEKIRRSISKWSSYLKELEGEENDWAQEFSQQFIPYANKWLQWDNVDFQFNKDDSRYFKSRFIIDPRVILQKPEFSNIMAIQYWRITRVQSRTDSLLKHTDKLVALIQKELKK
ncbi:MAG: DUF6090 family protein [Flavobacteriaceae bacterium]